MSKLDALMQARSFWALFGVLTGAAGVLWLQRADELWADLKVPYLLRKQFNRARAQMMGLGKKISRIEAAPIAWHGFHKYAMVVWLEPLRELVELPNDGSDARRHPDASRDHSDKWYDESKRREMFGNPDGLLPPIGGVAKKWSENPEYWSKRVGGLEWDCVYSGSSKIFFQLFEGGLIFGPIHSVRHGNQGQHVIVHNSGKWFVRASPMAEEAV